MGPRVAFIAPPIGGSANHRSNYPAQALKERGWDAWAQDTFPNYDEVDVVVCHRPLDKRRTFECQDLQRCKVTVLVDEDDFLADLPSSFDKVLPRDYQERLDLHDMLIREADGLSVTTEPLLELYGSMAKRTWRNPNFLPRWVQGVRFYRLKRDHEPVRVGWMGLVRTHRHDLEWLAPYADEAFEGAVFSTVGDVGTPVTLRLMRTPAETFPVEHDQHAMYLQMARADIGIVPLKPDEKLNVSKSWLKALEYMTLGKPVVVTRLPEQEALVEHGVTGFLASSPMQFALYVRQLVKDADLRQHMGAAAKERASQMAIEDMVEHTWERMLLDVTEKEQRSVLSSRR